MNTYIRQKTDGLFVLVLSRAVDPIRIDTNSFSLRREKSKEKKMTKCKEIGNNCNFIKLV